MRKTTGLRTVETTNLVSYPGGTGIATAPWTPEQAADAEYTINVFAETHEGNRRDAGYVREFGVPEIFEYRLPGLWVVAFVTDGTVDTVMSVADDDVTRLHTAVRHERPVTVTYVKADGEETVRTIEPRSLALTKAGRVIVKAADRTSSEMRSFRADRVLAYTVHRSRFTVRLESPAPGKTELVRAFQGRPVRWTPAPGTRVSPLTVSGRCLNPGGEHPGPANGRCPVCAAVPVYA